MYTLSLLMSYEEFRLSMYGMNFPCSPRMIRIPNLASPPSLTILARPSHSACPAFATVSNTIYLYLSLAHRVCVVDKACLPPSGMSSGHSGTSDIAHRWEDLIAETTTFYKDKDNVSVHFCSLRRPLYY